VDSIIFYSRLCPYLSGSGGDLRRCASAIRKLTLREKGQRPLFLLFYSSLVYSILFLSIIAGENSAFASTRYWSAVWALFRISFFGCFLVVVFLAVLVIFYDVFSLLFYCVGFKIGLFYEEVLRRVFASPSMVNAAEIYNGIIDLERMLLT
jgi:hypothetical protein